MDVGLLKAFLEVNRSKHFGRAAKNLFISQSAISARIKQLEDELGTRLFNRDRNNIELTDAGKKFLGYAESILNSWHRAKQEIAIPEGIDTLLSIGALPGIWDIFLDDWLIWVHTNNVSTALQASVMQSDLIIRELLDGVLDLGFVFDPPKTPQLLVKQLLPMPLIMVSAKSGLTVERAVSENYIYIDWGNSFAMTHARLFPDIPAPRLRAGFGRIALSFLKKSIGTTYLPEAMVEKHLGTSLFRVDDAPVIHKDAYAIYAQTSSKRKAIEATLVWFEED